MKCSRLELTGQELVTLACSLAIAFSEKYEEEDLNRLRTFFAAISTNIGIIQSENKNKFK